MKSFVPIVHKYTSRVMGIIVNAHLVESENGVILIDGTIAVSSANEIRTMIDDKIKKPLLGVLLTHGHPDHYVGVGNIVKDDKVPFISTRQTAMQVTERDEMESAAMSRAFGNDYPLKKIFPDQFVKDGDTVVFDNVTYTIKDYGACESDADSIWMYNSGREQHVFTGDLIYNHMHSFLKDGHILNWLKMLDRLEDEFDLQTVFYPAHGDICGKEMIHWQRAYLQMALSTLSEITGGRSELSGIEQDYFFRKVQSFLPNEDLLDLLKYKFDETIRVLSNIRLSKSQFTGGTK